VGYQNREGNDSTRPSSGGDEARDIWEQGAPFFLEEDDGVAVGENRRKRGGMEGKVLKLWIVHQPLFSIFEASDFIQKDWTVIKLDVLKASHL